MLTHIVIVRTGSNIIDTGSYNCQEIGMAKALARRGLNVSVIMAGKQQKKTVYTVSDHFFTVYSLPVKSIDIRLGYFVGINKLLISLNPTILQIHDMGVFMSWWVSRWAKKHNVPCYLIQGVYQTTPKLIAGMVDGMITRLFGRGILRNAAGVGCKSYKASEYVKKCYNRETEIVYIGLDESRFNGFVVNDWRNKLGIEDKKVLLYVGKLEERRNPLFLLDILENLSDEYVLLLVGTGPLELQIKEKIKKDELEKRVFVLGKLNQNELPAVYVSSDLFLLASSYEIYGMVIMESMFFGVPVLSSHSGGAEVIIDNMVNGIIEEEFDAIKWSCTINDVFSNEENLQNMKTKAKEKIYKKLLWDYSIESFLDLYKLDYQLK